MGREATSSEVLVKIYLSDLYYKLCPPRQPVKTSGMSTQISHQHHEEEDDGHPDDDGFDDHEGDAGLGPASERAQFDYTDTERPVTREEPYAAANTKTTVSTSLRASQRVADLQTPSATRRTLGLEQDIIEPSAKSRKKTINVFHPTYPAK
ncbi:hypothetical protein B0T14DRAFT_559241 [Immersiella caudata]|uniref:Uncharacterized protein n=1 Tax=Immersiella caudata TaxID=314043 RepID=A0AA40CBN5_9PEZI|nr:hypothetical protein B0T14DRAFT_559241 [Immersiella caudata]